MTVIAIDMETATLFIVGHHNSISRGALLLVSDVPVTPEGVKTEESDARVTRAVDRASPADRHRGDDGDRGKGREDQALSVLDVIALLPEHSEPAQYAPTTDLISRGEVGPAALGGPFDPAAQMPRRGSSRWKGLTVSLAKGVGRVSPRRPVGALRDHGQVAAVDHQGRQRQGPVG